MSVDQIANHPNADKSVTFKGLAAYEKSGAVKPFEYHPVPLSPDHLDIAITHCGICGTDIHKIDSGWGPSAYPMIPGHEIVGTVTRIGSSVTHLKVGDRVGVGAQSGSCLNRQGNCAECAEGWENHCGTGGVVMTYGSKLPDGQITQGGYAESIRVDSRFAFKLPEKLPSEFAAPLLCGGVTVYAPLSRYLTKPGLKVGIVGIGGLGHMGVKFAVALQKYKQGGQVDVTAISQSSRKKDDALAMGATAFLDMSDAPAVSASKRRFDVVLCTADGDNQSLAHWLALVKFDGTFIMVGAPNKPLEISIFSLLPSRVKIVGSFIGSIAEIKDMLLLAAEHEVYPIIEQLPMDQANEGIKRVRESTVRYRVVLENKKA